MKTRIVRQQIFIGVLSFSIVLSDGFTSLFLLMLSITNKLYEGVFGEHADVWRESISCSIMEVMMFVGTESSLILSVYLSASSFKHISSMIPRIPPKKTFISVILLVSLCLVLLGIVKVMVWNFYKADDFNYYCLPFQMMQIDNFTMVGIQTAIIIINITLIASYIVIQFLLFNFIRAHIQKSSKVLKSNIKHRKIAIRMSCLISSNIITWLPILVTQLFIMYGDDISPSTFLMVVLTSLPVNLIIDPAILGIPFLRNMLKPK